MAGAEQQLRRGTATKDDPQASSRVRAEALSSILVVHGARWPSSSTAAAGRRKQAWQADQEFAHPCGRSGETNDSTT